MTEDNRKLLEELSLPNMWRRCIVGTAGAIILYVGARIWAAGSEAFDWLTETTTTPMLLHTLGIAILGLLVLGFLLYSQHKKTAKLQELWNGALHIFNASYGFKGKWIDVTEAVRSRVSDNKLTVSSGNHLGGDPWPEQTKELVIQYWHDGKHFTENIPEKHTASLPITKKQNKAIEQTA